MELPNLPDDILTQILEIVGAEAAWHLGPFVRTGKRSYALVHQPQVFQKCILWSIHGDPIDIFIGGRFRGFFQKCMNVGNIDVVYFESLRLASRHWDLVAAVAVLETNFPSNADSTLAYGVFNVCLGEEVKASEAFQKFIQHHDNLKSERVRQICNNLEWKLSGFYPAHMDTNASTFKYPDDDVIKALDCGYDHDTNFEHFCKACIVFCTARNICRMI